MQSHLLVLLGSFIGGLFGLVFGLLYMGFIVAVLVGNWKLYAKAGKPGWASLVPIYNIIVLYEIIGREPIKILFLLIPVVNIYFLITAYVSLAKSFGKRSMGDYLLTIFFAPLYLGLGNARYEGPSEGSGAVADTFGTTPTY
jgi:hypothetical protein